METKCKFKWSPRVLYALGIDLYATIPNTVMEMLANAWDGHATMVDIWIRNDRVTIQDNGIGMDKTHLQNVYLWIGMDKRQQHNGDEFTFMANGKTITRPTIGNKGIGKLAGFGIANVMKLISWKDNAAHSLIIDMPQIQKEDDIEEVDLTIKPVPYNKEALKSDSGTLVILEQPKINFKALDKIKLMADIARNMPLNDDFIINVNGTECKRTDVKFQVSKEWEKNLVYPYNGKKYNLGRVEAKFGLASNRLDPHIKPGIIVKVRGKGIGEPRLFGMEKNIHMSAYISYLTGEIHCQMLDEKDTGGLITAGRDGFITHNEHWITFEHFVTDLLHDMLGEFDRKQQIERKNKELKKIGQELKTITHFFTIQHKERVDKVNKKAKPGQKRGKYTRQDQDIDVNKLQIRINGHVYKLTYTGNESIEECSIDHISKIVNINTSHPMYNFGKISKSSPLQVFKAIAFVYANTVTTSPHAMAGEYYVLSKKFAEYMLKRRQEKGDD